MRTLAPRCVFAIVVACATQLGCAEGSNQVPPAKVTGSGGAGTGAGGAGGAGDGGAGGDGAVDPGEECDGAAGATTCADLGFMGGQLACSAQCAFDTSACDACGNGLIQPALGEDCDFDAMGNPLVLATCASLGFSGSAANPGCSPQCQYDVKPCQCGDGAIQLPEACDGADLGGQTCASLGYTGGTLACLGSCDLDTSGCTQCGNGAVEAGETCDDGNVMSGDGCSATCQTEVVACDPDGVYVKQGAPVSYSCCLGLVSINVSSFLFSADGASIASSPSNPVPMTGAATTCPSGSFSNSGFIAGGCAETYTLSGSFVDQDTWSGTYSVQFTGSDCTCFNGQLGAPCINQVFPVTATR